MDHMKWRASAAIVLALAVAPARAQAPATPASPLTVFDPLDAPALKAMDWPGVLQSPLWTRAASPTEGQQVGKESEWRVDKVARTRFADQDMELSLRVGRQDLAARRIVVVLPVVITNACAAARARLDQAYGGPSAEREARSAIAIPNTRLRTEFAQWREGATTVTLDCLELEKPRGVVYMTDIEFEPTAKAAPLLPLFALSCPGLLPGGAQTPTLIFDSRERLVTRSGPDPVVKARHVTITPDLAGFDLDGEQVAIDRASGRYTVARRSGGTAREGACATVEAPDTSYRAGGDTRQL